MSNTIYDFLTESFLFREAYINEQYSGYSDKQIENELLNYREYVLKNIDVILQETKDGYKQLSVSMEFYNSNMLDINMLKQCSLYVHKFVLDDPLFKLTSGLDENEMHKVMSEYLGMNGNNAFNRSELCKAIAYMKSLTSGVVTGYIKFIPGSYMHEPPKDIPISYSETYFSDLIQKSILDFFHENIEVCPGEVQDNGGVVLYTGKKLEPCRTIGIDIRNHSERLQHFYMLFENEIVSFDDATRTATFKQTLPKAPPSLEYFNAWVYQSINQVANSFSSQIEREIMLSSKLNTMYLTQSPFVDSLLKLSFEQSNDSTKRVQTHTFNSLLDIPLPIIEDASLGEILAVRYEDGDVFENFRSELERKLAELRSIKDHEELKIKTENAMHELCEIQVSGIDRKVKTLRSKFFRNSAILVGGLAGTVITSGFSLFASAFALGQGYSSFKDYQAEVKQNPAYLLWKIQKNTKK